MAGFFLKWVWQALYIKKAHLSSMKFSFNRCVCNTVIIFYYNGIPLEMFLLSIKFDGKIRLPGIQDSMS